MYKTISVLGIALAVLSTQALGKKCHLETTVYHRQTSACGEESCIPNDDLEGTGELQVDGSSEWDGDGANYEDLSNGDGVDVNTDGIQFHIDPLGIPDEQDEPTCKVVIGDYTNLGTPDVKNDGDPGVFGTEFHCTHDWDW
ncbi:hypothetical protein GGR53DRAFT_470789 [Hypoxylon sp. FL1150]|nr:hypothetical protein GGR53DRAFT_470789 [Hypoxylon sp. FL1150]